MADDALDDDLGELDEDLLAELDSKKDGDAKKDKKKKTKGAGAHIVLRIALGLSGVMLVAGFFLDWIKLAALNPQQAAQTADGGARFVSGANLAMNGNTLAATVGGTAWWVLWAIPLFGAALAAVGFLGSRWSGVAGALMGLLIVGYGVVMVVMLFFSTTSYGLWLILGGAFMAVASGTLAWARSRQDRPGAALAKAKAKKA